MITPGSVGDWFTGVAMLGALAAFAAVGYRWMEDPQIGSPHHVDERVGVPALWI